MFLKRLCSNPSVFGTEKKCIILFLFTLIFAMQNAWSTKLYKIVDENGKVTFSQFPPDANEQNKQVEDVVLSREHKEAKLDIKVYGENEYCGDLLLTDWTYKGKSSDAYKISHLEKRITRWKKDIVNLEQRVEKLTQRQFEASSRKAKYETDKIKNQRYKRYTENHQREMETIKKYRCAIAWGEGKLNNSYGRESIEKMNEEVKRLRGVLARIETKRETHCGKKPIFDPSKEHLKHDYESWEKCSGRYASDIKKVKRQIANISLTAN